MNKKQGVAKPLPVFKSLVKDSQRQALAAEAATAATAAQKQDDPDNVTRQNRYATASTTASAFEVVGDYK
ncbi:MAG: hypothetical protein LUE94_03625, partial [Clostridiales bacterium]|nr:hypothetical protein [Clostridiales bacterium]